MIREPRTYELKIGEEDVVISWLEARRMIEEEGAILIDLREKEDAEKNPLKNSVNIKVDDVFLYKFRFEKDRKYILIDYMGVTSRILAEYLRRHGIKAYAVKGGIKSIKEEGL